MWGQFWVNEYIIYSSVYLTWDIDEQC